jgi:PAS domain S-box-containing protein
VKIRSENNFKTEILVVDDVRENLMFLDSMLSDAGYRVRPAISGAIALDAIGNFLPDIILLDIMMPDMDGYEVLQYLKKNKLTRDIPVIFITAASDIDSMVKGFELGAVDYVSKPFRRREVLARVANHLELYRLRCRAEEQKNVSEGMLSGILDSAAEAIVTVDESQNIILYNKGAEEIFGYQHDEVIGKPLEILIPEKYRATHSDKITEFEESQTHARFMANRGGIEGRRKNGKVFPAEASLSKMNLNGKRTYTAVLHDISERKIAEKALSDSFAEAIYTLIRASEFRDDQTGAHVSRISYYTKIMAEEQGMDAEYCNQIFFASPMHDIGKIGIPDSILLKPGGFTEEEWEIMKTHTTIGANILANNSSPYLKMAELIALNHHESWDGRGYPMGLKGEEIPLCARIMQLADVYDALRSERPYKKPFNHEQSVEIICKGDGRTNPSNFDPEVLNAFSKRSDTMAEIFAQQMENAEKVTFF